MIECGDHKLPNEPKRIIVFSDSPGCTLDERGDLYDLGFTSEEIENNGGVTITTSDVVIEIRKSKSGGNLK